MTGFRVRLLYCAYILTLGLQRLTFGLESGAFGSWLCLIATHVVEMLLWWTLALDSGFNQENLTFSDVLRKAVSFQLPPQCTILLLLVPLIVLFIVLSGPSNQKKIKSN